MRRRLVWIGLLIVVCVGLIAAGAAATDHTGPYQLQADQPEPDNTVTRIALQSTGDAVWTIRFRTRLATTEDVDEYESFQAEFADNSSRYLDPFEERMTAVVDGAADQYDREMRAVDFEASTTIQEVPRRWGVVSFQFRWEGFAAETDGKLAVGDVFAGGFYIGEGDVLELAAPDGYRIAEVDPTPDEAEGGVVQWNGREDFADGRPQLLAAPEAGATGGEGGTLPGGTTGVVAGVIGLAMLVSLGVLAVRRTRSTDEPPTDSTDRQSDEATATQTDASADSTPRGHDLVTNETQVVDLLDQHDGQLKQADIVDSLDWSKSKTSRVLSELADDGTVEKLRIGRENVIRLQTDE
ncbi:IclR-like helix-turn-helix domain-containing protein [Halohasta litchfieldiae]|jgi:hypothetical protein|uniref:IclR helix-turn-helix domain-containing protein n=1 Tax=Halohasta litchfieldiae TaxID=1073996 RepID=A0A1H6R8B7_9EURY|nr:helix-turn-helix domain-containing protein [Halohasta litchfieldiae]ATW88506.1 IclR-like helix-turn-helix domain-containing protein [Halohasta litchfieldiae]SEI49484.1 IclR helix-turn-helix domain-containing protein [Halohasta litchfieldiae]